MKNLNWNLLRVFIVIVENRSLSKAAAHLHRSQPAVSNALKNLEEQVGYKLLHRAGPRFELTEKGQLLFSECRQINSRVERIGELIDDHKVAISGTLKLHLASGIVSPFLNKFLRDFHEKFPKVVFNMSISESEKIQNDTLIGNIPFGICLQYQEHENLDYIIFSRERFGFFCGRTHRLFDAKNVTPEDMKDESFVSFQTDQFEDALWPVAQFRMMNGLKGKIIGTSPYLEEVRRMVISGIGIAPFPVHAMRDDVYSGTLRQLPPFSNLPVIDHFLVTNPRLKHTKVEAMFLKELTKALKTSPLSDRTYDGTMK